MLHKKYQSGRAGMKCSYRESGDSERLVPQIAQFRRIRSVR